MVNKGHEVHFYAGQGSTQIGNFHPMKLAFGTYTKEIHGSITALTLDDSKSADLLEMDFVIDMTANAVDVEIIRNYNDYRRYVCYRNGYAAFGAPRLPASKRHYVVPSKQNKMLFKQNQFDAEVVKYGISDFYCPGDEPYYWRPFQILKQKDYWLFPHRPTPEKGTSILLRLARELPSETFVVAGHTPIAEHQSALMELRRSSPPNIKFVDIPLEPQHHFYKRELYRHAKAILSPFDITRYYEGFGLSSAEAVACGTPLLITDSASTQELWEDGVDSIFCDGFHSFKMAIQHFSTYDLKPINKFSTEDYVNNYLKLAKEYNNNNSDAVPKLQIG